MNKRAWKRVTVAWGLGACLAAPAGGAGLAAGDSGLRVVAGVPGVKAPPGVRVRVYADHARHGLSSPTALAFDSRGHLLVAETHRFGAGVEDNRKHLYWYLDDLAARTVADRRALHEKWAQRVPLAGLTEKSELVRWLEDRDGDGVADQSKVFAEGFRDLLDGTAAGVFELDGRVWFACIPKLWWLRDKDGDGVADERQVIEEGFGVRVSFSGHDLNGFALGPDGRVYGTIGDRGMSLKTRDGVDYQLPGQGAVFRMETDGSRFEVIHTGLRNPKEIAFNEWGDAFTVDNNADQGDKARLVQVVDGADSGWEYENQTMASFHREIGLAERPPNRWLAERMWEPANDDQPAYLLPPVANLASGPSGLTCHPGAGFFDSERGRFLVCDYRGGAAISGVWSFRVEREGAGMRLVDARPLLEGVAATDVEYSWDGRVVVADFGGGWVSHQGGRVLVLEREDGKGVPDGVAAAIAAGFGGLPSVDLLELLGHPDQRLRVRAQLALAAKPGAVEQFAAALRSGQRWKRLHGVWGLGMLARGWRAPRLADAGFGPLPEKKTAAAALEHLVKVSEDPDEEVRAQAVKAVGDAGIRPAELRLEVLLGDRSPRVRAMAAIAAGKLRAMGVLDQVLDLLERDGRKDPVLWHAGTFALERISAPEQTLGLLGAPSPRLRLAAVVALRRLRDARVAAFLADEDPRVVEEAVRAIHDLALEDGRAGVAGLLDDYLPGKPAPVRGEMTMRRLLGSAFRLGGDLNARRLVAVALCPKVAEAVRVEALRLLGLWGEPPPVDQVTGHWRPLAAREAESARKLVAQGIAPLLGGEGKLLAAALEVAGRLKLELPALDDAALRALVARTEAGPEARVKALDLWMARGGAGAGEILSGLVADGSDVVAAAAMRWLAGVSPERAAGLLGEAARTGSTARRQAAWRLLGTLPGDAAAATIEQGLEAVVGAGGVSPVALEVLAAAAQRKEPSVAAALARWNRWQAESQDPLVRHLPSLEGGDAAAGERLYQSHPAAQCTRCHAAGGNHVSGVYVGPDLGGVALRGDRRYLLESLVAPAARLVPGYATVVLEFPNGGVLTGTLVGETEGELEVEAADGVWRVRRVDLARMSATSPMPPVAGLLRPEEVRDLVAWLATLQEQGNARPARGEAQPLEVAKLVPPSTGARAGPGGAPGAAPSPASAAGAKMPAVSRLPQAPRLFLPGWAWTLLVLWFGLALRGLTRRLE